MTRVPWLKAILLSTALSVSLAARAQVQLGTQLGPFHLNDQHDKDHTVDSAVKLIAFARDMEGNKIVTKTLEALPPEKQKERGLVYVADVSGMPSLVAKMFALPKMRKYPYAVLLDREGKATKAWPSAPKQATLLVMQELKVVAIRTASSAEELKKAIEEPPTVAPSGSQPVAPPNSPPSSK